MPEGVTFTSSPTFTSPANTVPVTTVPAPPSVKQRSTASLNPAPRAGLLMILPLREIPCRPERPSPVTLDTGKIGASRRNVGATSARISCSHSARRAASTRSILVIATAPSRTPRSCTISRCSTVCGIGPSSAATTSSTKSMPVAPDDHVVDEPLVAGHVDEAEHAAVRQRQVGVAELDRDAARLLLLQAVGVDAGERLHQRGLAVVDVACGADDHGSSRLWRAAPRTPARPRGSAGRA